MNSARPDPTATADPSDDRSATEAMRLRALAHPLRWSLIDLLEAEGEATATRCAALLGSSVASCAYHLGMLGKYGWAELAPRQGGRERPWRLTTHTQHLASHDADPDIRRAALAARDAFLDHEQTSLRQRLAVLNDEPDDWRTASCVAATTAHVTAEELAAMRRDMMAVLQRHDDREDNPALRPPGTRPARIFFTTTVTPR